MNNWASKNTSTSDFWNNSSESRPPWVNLTSDLNATTDLEDLVIYVSYIFVTVLVVASLIAMFVNIVVFASVYWIRRPLPPILKMSLSLAAADALSSSMFAVTLFINTYLPTIGINIKWLQVVLEMVRLSGILITVTHLLALSLNHYIGILKPMHYNAIVTRRKVNAAIIMLWIGPSLFIVALFMLEADSAFWRENFGDGRPINRTNFMDTFAFRITFSSCFFIPIVLMAISYTHILMIVRNQQNTWKHLSRCGSSKWMGRATKNLTANSKVSREKKQLEGNIRAIYTTLLILGSCVIGWMPALLVFILMCKSDCYINGQELNDLNQNYIFEVMSLRLLENMLVILKMLANPIIYSIRMKEIQDGTKRMYSAIATTFCHAKIDNLSDYRMASRRTLNTSNKSTTIRSMKSSITSTNRQDSNRISIGRSELVTTLL